MTDTNRNLETVRFAVMTPTYNAAEYLQECLDSVQAQRGPGIEVAHLILDNGSTDGTLEILARNDVVMVPREPGSTLASAMGLGFDACVEHGCDLIAYLGGDDMMLPGAFEAVADIYRRERNPMIFSTIRWVNGDMSVVQGELGPPPKWLNAKIHAAFRWNYLAAMSSFITPAGYAEVGPYNYDMLKTPDYEFWTRALSKGIPFSRLDYPTAIFRRHGGNDSMNFNEVYIENLDYVMDNYGPKTTLGRVALGYGFKAWVYAKHPAWTKTQFKTKFAGRSLRGG